MHAFRRFTLFLALTLPVMPAVIGSKPEQFFIQSHAGSKSNPGPGDQSTQNQGTAGELQGQLSVQARIRNRREQRRATAIHDAYDHKWESYADMGYLRFHPGPFTASASPTTPGKPASPQFKSERLGYTLDGRGYYGTAYVGLNFSNITRPAISQYDVMFGPVYRFYLQPKYSISGRVMGGGAYGNFSGDTNGFKNICPPGVSSCLLYPDGYTFAASASVIGEYNLTPSIGFKLAPEYFFTGFGSTIQASRGFTAGISLPLRQAVKQRPEIRESKKPVQQSSRYCIVAQSLRSRYPRSLFSVNVDEPRPSS